MIWEKRKISSSIIIFLFCSFMYQPLYESVNAITNNIDPVEQLPSINNIGAPNHRYSDILVKNSLAYCDYYGYAISVFDFNNLKERITLGRYFLESFTYSVYFGSMFFYGEDLCYLNSSILTIIDISNPNNLTIKNTFEMNQNLTIYGALKIHNNIGYLAHSKYNDTEYSYQGVLTLLNFENLSNPIIGKYENDKPINDVSIHGNYAFLMDNSRYEYVNGFEIIDISDPTNLTFISEWQGVCNPKSIEVINNYLFLETYDRELLVFDVSNPEFPQQISVYDEITQMNDIYFDGNFAYIIYDDGLFVLDIANPESINLVGKKKITLQGNGIFTDLVVENDFVYALRTSEYAGREIFVFDVSNPSSPKKLYPLGVRVSHEFTYFLFMSLFWFWIPVVIISIIAIPIIVVRKRKKKRRQEMRDQVNEIQQKSTIQEESINENT